MDDFTTILKINYEKAIDQDMREEISGLSQLQFISLYEASKPWSIGPFTQRTDLTFYKTSQMPDPTKIGWTSSSIFNPSVVVEGEKIYLFYRAAVKKESLGSRIGLAIYTPETGWVDQASNPIIYPTADDEILSVEDPKVYKYLNEETGETEYIMFYNGAWEASEELIEEYKKPYGNIAVDIKSAVSSDLINWVKQGVVVPHEITKLWVKGAVVPRDGDGSAVKINGEYLMFLSEGCGDKQYVGHSKNMKDWEFIQNEYLPLPTSMGKNIYEVASATVDGEHLVLDFLYNDNQDHHAGAQALYNISDPFTVLDFTTGSCLSWGGMSKYKGEWIFAQGWDATRGTEEMYFYSAPIHT
jgi:predicted GH43/DUF377 family glycosyl hydrolase